MIDLARLVLDPAKIQTVAVVISRTRYGNLHIGIAHRDSDKFEYFTWPGTANSKMNP